MKKKYLICGAGGFIGGHLTNSLMKQGHEVICADIKPLEYWFQLYEENKNYSLDLKEYENCIKVTKGVDYIYNMAIITSTGLDENGELIDRVAEGWHARLVQHEFDHLNGVIYHELMNDLDDLITVDEWRNLITAST